MRLFQGRKTPKTTLQAALDGHHDEGGCATLQEPQPAPLPTDAAKPPFKPGKAPESLFQVDLLGGWVKP